ncbi:MAG: phosphate ABC transporter permease PstA [Bacteroidota bacterium]|nr:phosphate ABC transporter permease PstA [Bacteroidota bacterium]
MIIPRKHKDIIFRLLALLFLLAAVAMLFFLLFSVISEGLGRLNWQILTSYSSRKAAEAGILPGIVGSILMVLLTMILALPIGVAAAIYLEEYSTKNRFSRILELNIANLAGVPSIVYGLLGLGLFVRTFELGRSLLAGSLTMSLLVMPMIIIATREAIKMVPYTLREASYAVGATKWETISQQVIPVAFPNILTGVILAVSRAIGETAPLITIGALTYVTFLPDGLLSQFTIMPIQIFNWISRPQEAFHLNAAAGIIILLLITLSLNALAIILRNKYSKKL